MRITDLSIFRDVAQHGSMTRVADLRNASQPGISRIIRELEREVNVPLMRRTGRGIELTGAGKAFLAFAQTCLKARQDLEGALEVYREPEKKVLSIAIPIGIGWLVDRKSVV